MTPNFKMFLVALFFVLAIAECRAKMSTVVDVSSDELENQVLPCEFGCDPYVNCMPCEVLKGKGYGGWCWIDNKKPAKPK